MCSSGACLPSRLWPTAAARVRPFWALFRPSVMQRLALRRFHLNRSTHCTRARSLFLFLFNHASPSRSIGMIWGALLYMGHGNGTAGECVCVGAGVMMFFPSHRDGKFSSTSGVREMSTFFFSIFAGHAILGF